MRSLAFAGFVILILVVSWVCGQRRLPSGTQYYCPMHPDYVTTTQGDCPVCGMRLISVAEKSPLRGQDRQDRVPIEIPPEQQRVLGLSISEATTVPLGKAIHAVGRVSMAPPSRMPATNEGVVQEVYCNPGAGGALRVRAGEPILSVSHPLDIVVMRAPGPLLLLSVPQPGFRVEKGKEAYLYIDLSRMFVLADFRSVDIPFIRTGLPAKASLPAYPGHGWQGSVVEASQQFDERMQTLKVKLQFQNDQPNIWQGMLAMIELETPTERVLTIPESAVIADGEDAVVFVAQSHDRFEPRKVEIGLRAKSLVQVKRGLSAGDRVVTSATFLLDSESRLRALFQPSGDGR